MSVADVTGRLCAGLEQTIQINLIGTDNRTQKVKPSINTGTRSVIPKKKAASNANRKNSLL